MNVRQLLGLRNSLPGGERRWAMSLWLQSPLILDGLC